MGKEKITVVDNEIYTAWCYPEKKLIHHQFHRFCRGNEFRKNLTLAVEALEKYKCIKWLSDDREFTGPLDPDDWKWGETNFTDRGIASGWKYSAMVMAPTAFAQISTSALVDYFSARGIEAVILTDVDKAVEWLESK